MKIIFFGTPDYVLPILNSLNKVAKIVGVVTQPPKPTGRKKFLTYSPVDTWAHKRKIPILFDFDQPLPQADLGILASYGSLIPPEVISFFPKGILVIHPSLLPLFRGASPVPAAIVSNANPTGVTIFKMDEAIDHGPIITQSKEEILPNDTGDTLRDRLFLKSAKVLIETLPAYLSGKITPKPQDETKATYTKILTREDGLVSLDKDRPCQIERKLRAMTPWPGIWTLLKSGKRLKILKAHLTSGKFVPDEVQLEGKNPVSWKQFSEAYPKVIFL